MFMPTFDTPEPIAVTLDVGVGDIRVVASDRTDTVVDVRPSDPDKKSDVIAAQQALVEYAGGRLSVRTQKGWRWSFRAGRESIDVHIELPTGSQVGGEAGVAALHCTGRIGGCRFKTGVGDIQLDRAGSLELKAGAGDITVERVAGDADVSTAGAVEIGSVDGAAVVKNSNGDTWIGDVTGDVRVKAANGRITIDRARAAASVKTANGDLRLGEVERGAVLAESANGRIDVGIRDGVAAWLDLKTGFGNVQNDLQVSDRPSLDEEAVDVRARTAYGDITIRRSLPNETGKDEA
jgi:Putative adhesin